MGATLDPDTELCLGSVQCLVSASVKATTWKLGHEARDMPDTN